MKFIIGENTSGVHWGWINYRGVIGIFYNSTWDAICAYAIFALLIVLSVIGLVTVLKWILFGFKPKEPEDPHKKWMRTGKM